MGGVGKTRESQDRCVSKPLQWRERPATAKRKKKTKRWEKKKKKGIAFTINSEAPSQRKEQMAGKEKKAEATWRSWGGKKEAGRESVQEKGKEGKQTYNRNYKDGGGGG